MTQHPRLGPLVHVFQQVLQGLGRRFTSLVTYEILVKILAAAVLGPFSAWVLAVLISSTGSIAVSNEQILSFAFSPMGFATLIVSVSLGFLITFLEQAGLICIASASYTGEACTAIAALWRAVRRAGGLLLLALLQTGLYSACALLPAAVAGAAYLAWLSDHDINYYLAETPPAFWKAVAVGGLALTGLLLASGWMYLRLMFALPVCVLAKASPLAGLKTSFRLTQHAVLKYAAILLIWLLAMAVLGGVLGGLVQIVEYLAIRVAGQRLAALLPTLAGLVVLNLLTAAVISFVSVTTNALVVVRLYHDAAGDVPELQPEQGPVEPAAIGLPRWLSIKRLAATAAVLLLASTVGVTYLLVEQIGIEDHVAVTAHRGSSRSAPENTISAVEAAIRQGADFAEIDVQETADGVIVVLHDSDLMRITGLGKKIWEVDYAEIESLDAGSWFSPEFQGERIPTLQHVIDAARGRIRLNIELKFNGHDQKLVERVVGILDENDFHSQCVVSSLDYEGLIRAKRLDERLTVGHIVSVAVGDVAKLDVDFLSVHHGKVTPGLIRSLHRAGRQIHVWTVNDAQTMSSQVDLGVDNVITDEPETMRFVLNDRAQMSNGERILLGVRNWLAQ